MYFYSIIKSKAHAQKNKNDNYMLIHKLIHFIFENSFLLLSKNTFFLITF
jgi:hypothetical protein